ncbi:MAG: hypothetical protein ABIA75_05485 [Candidatus Neomarinimicrobiota bacterium]
MLYWIYILITILIVAITLIELFSEKKWQNQIAFAMILIPLLLRIFGIK